MSVIYDGDEKDIAKISNFGLLVECMKLHANLTFLLVVKSRFEFARRVGWHR